MIANIENCINNFKKLIETFQKVHNDLVFLEADKSNMLVAADRGDYNKAVGNLLKNDFYNKIIETSLVPTIENK